MCYTASAAADPNGWQMIRAIVADDEHSLPEIAKRFLEKEGGFEIDTASTHTSATNIRWAHLLSAGLPKSDIS